MASIPPPSSRKSRTPARRRIGHVAVLAPFILLPASASAHTTDAVAPDRLLAVWTADPFVLVLSLLTGWLYVRGLGNLHAVAHRAGRGEAIGRIRVGAFFAGLLTLAAALTSPLDTATATVFSAHMVQHVLLVAVAPPLILLGQPMTVMLNGLPRGWRRPIASLPRRIPGMAALLAVLAMPAVAWLVHAGTLWLWHIPSLYDAAVRHERIHAVEHASFVATAFLFWWTIVPAGRHARNAVGPAMGILSVFAMGMQGAVLGIILTFWGSPLYPVYVGRSDLWGISALSDQRLAGLIMWIPAGSIYVVAALLLLRSWFHEGEEDAPNPNTAGSPGVGPPPDEGALQRLGPARTVP